MAVIGVIEGSGFTCTVARDTVGRIWFYADAAIDADGTRPAHAHSRTLPYVVVPSLVIDTIADRVRGCRARVSWAGRSIVCVVADAGPRHRIGELSIAAAEALCMPSSPGDGGIAAPDVLYELWPGIAAEGVGLA
jgi:hypothetical protein